MALKKGGFTLPGEAGFEKRTLELAKKWGADVIRDSDGTALSEELLNAGYDIYSTICIIREHNEFAKAHLDCRQQTILCTPPQILTGEALQINLMESFFAEQFEINSNAESLALWQVYDRTENKLIDTWEYEKGIVTLRGKKWHTYTVSFFAYRVWEEISMYNHTTNHWEKEHLMQIDPILTETMLYLCDWMDAWCQTHPESNVVRFTSMFYNFAWIWGSNPNNRHLFTDWSSYDFTVSPKAFKLFSERCGYEMTLEDFVNKGLRRSGHTVPDKRKCDWMAFINDVVIREGKKLIDIVHRYGKKAYVFYDDSWVGVEPNNPRFAEFGFDGLIKCVFSGFEVRLCANAVCETHEIRLHPYLFPVGLCGLPTFSKGGDPTRDAKAYWARVRRALLRKPVDRIGLGGYLSLTKDFPDFVDYIEQLADEFRQIRDLHQSDAPMTLRPRIGVLTAYGNLRAWTLSGHFHETDVHDLIHILESLSGLPFDVHFLSFEDVKNGVPENIDVLISAGKADTAWSGGDCWAENSIVEAVSAFVFSGGAVLAVGEASALNGYDTYLRLAPLLGVDIDDGRYFCHGKWQYELSTPDFIPEGANIAERPDVRLIDAKTEVLCGRENPYLTSRAFGKGKGIYLGGFRYSIENTRLLQNLILYAAGESIAQKNITDNLYTECAYFEKSDTLVAINNTDETQKTRIDTADGPIHLSLPPMGTVSITPRHSKEIGWQF
jgi:1,3-beta-galactosyl-N-acetylhexosamine phosphorylase